MRITINPDRPVRKIPTSTRSITGVMSTSDKDGQAFESTLERDLMYLLKFDVTVDKFVRGGLAPLTPHQLSSRRNGDTITY